MTCVHFAPLAEARNRPCGPFGALAIFCAMRVQVIMWLIEHVHDVIEWPSREDGVVS